MNNREFAQRAKRTIEEELKFAVEAWNESEKKHFSESEIQYRLGKMNGLKQMLPLIYRLADKLEESSQLEPLGV